MGHSFRIEIGNIQCWAINDGDFAGSADMLFVNAPEDELSEALRRYELKSDHLPSTLTCMLVKTPANLVLVDTGFGAGRGLGGQVLPALLAEGFSPRDIDTVVLTHGHGDHIGGCLDEHGNISFSEASYYMWKDEWDFWTTESTLAMVPEWAASTARQQLPPISQRLRTIDRETQIVPGIRAIAAPGHTVGHMAVEIESQGERLLAMIDAALHPIQVEYPEWYSQLDQNPEQTIATRHTIYQRAAENESLALAFHFPPFPSLGHITRLNDRWKWSPIEK